MYVRLQIQDGVPHYGPEIWIGAASGSGRPMVSSVVKALEVLQAFDQGNPSLSIGQISSRLAMPKSSTHRLVATLERQGFLTRDLGGGKYRLGPKLLQLASAALAGLDLRQAARSHLERLSRELGDTVHLAVLDDGEVIYIDKIESPRRVQMISHVGGRAPAHCTGLGKAMLAHCSEQEIRHIAARRGLKSYTPATLTNVEELLAHLATVRWRGYAIDQGEHESMVRCVAAPIRDYQGRVVAAVSATTVIASWAPAHLEAMVARVLETTRAISASMGWPGPDQDQETPIQAQMSGASE
jgi:DNA-binding IclR family transcriptional regulator